MQIREIPKAKKNKIGYINKNGVKSEANENETFSYLTLFGMNIELIKPTGIKKAKNPDIFIMGSIWEVKTPISANRNTIKNRFREASRQASKIIFDLRFIKNNADKVEIQLINMFKTGGQVRRMLIIEKSGRLLDVTK
ncbi:hypothetical protein IJN73_01825 [Candidatus Saccharibacteria bacterium]|nr:hypothetical protein [Candidatus Saccharibacteria bacterium]MBR3414438.1 hypothetical protein [Candidatus Saccharibacteria bacterium]